MKDLDYFPHVAGIPFHPPSSSPNSVSTPNGLASHSAPLTNGLTPFIPPPSSTGVGWGAPSSLPPMAPMTPVAALPIQAQPLPTQLQQQQLLQQHPPAIGSATLSSTTMAHSSVSLSTSSSSSSSVVPQSHISLLPPLPLAPSQNSQLSVADVAKQDNIPVKLEPASSCSASSSSSSFSAPVFKKERSVSTSSGNELSSEQQQPPTLPRKSESETIKPPIKKEQNDLDENRKPVNTFGGKLDPDAPIGEKIESQSFAICANVE